MLALPFLGQGIMATNKKELTAQEKEQKAKKKNKKRWLAISLSILCFVVMVLSFLQIGVVYADKSWTHFYPEYDKVDLLPILQKKRLTDEDYEVLYRQTGLTKLGIDGLLEVDRRDRIIEIQKAFFKKQEVIVDHFNPYTYSEEINDVIPMAKLEVGDILVTATVRVSWLRYGHSALVVDPDEGIALESMSPGTSSTFNDVSDFSELANFMILRPKIPAEEKQQIVDYAKENLYGLPYRFTLGIFYKKNPETLKVSQCAHLVWYAYNKFGYDLDSTGGGVVKPQDMVRSDYVEVVQAYGFDLDSLWGKYE